MSFLDRPESNPIRVPAHSEVRSVGKGLGRWIGTTLGVVCVLAVATAAQQQGPVDPRVEFTEVETVATSAYVVSSTVHERDGEFFLYSGGGKSELEAFSIGKDGRLTQIDGYTLWKLLLACGRAGKGSGVNVFPHSRRRVSHARPIH